MLKILIFVLFQDLQESLFYFMVIAKQCTHLQPAPSTFTQLHPPTPSSIHLYLAHFNLKPSLCNTFNVIRTKILHVIRQFPKVRPKSCSFWLKVGMHGILEVLIRNPDINFWRNLDKSGPKNVKKSALLENLHIRYLGYAD